MSETVGERQVRATEPPGVPSAPGHGLPRPVVRTIALLALATLLQSACAYSVLPEFPVYLERRGASSAAVGAVIGAFFLASLLSQYPVGRLTDRLGPKPVLVGGAALSAVGTAGYLLTSAPAACVAWRMLQGAGTASLTVASTAFVAVSVPAAYRGRGFSAITAATMSGLAIGPVVGGVFGLARFPALWALTAGVGVLILGLVLATTLESRAPLECGRADRGERVGGDDLRSDRRTPAVTAILLAAVATGLLGGVYETCWTQLLAHRHASEAQVTLSWTLFALPFVLAAPLGGLLVDRADRRRLLLASLAVGSGFAFVYPFVAPVPALIVLGAFEGAGESLAGPAEAALLSGLVSRARLGRALGLAGSAQTAALAVGSLGGGALFGVAVPLPFILAGAVGLVLMACVRQLLPARAEETAAWR